MIGLIRLGAAYWCNKTQFWRNDNKKNTTFPVSYTLLSPLLIFILFIPLLSLPYLFLSFALIPTSAISWIELLHCTAIRLDLQIRFLCYFKSSGCRSGCYIVSWIGMIQSNLNDQWENCVVSLNIWLRKPFFYSICVNLAFCLLLFLS